MNDPFEAFQVATTYIAEGDWRGALPLLRTAKKGMAGDPDFEALWDRCRQECAK